MYHSSQNIVLSAPTSAGKTTIFELALLRMVKEWEGYPEKRLAIYIAPTKVSVYDGIEAQPRLFASKDLRIGPED